jgi:hypothetical protein
MLPILMWPHALHLCSPGQQWLGQMALERMALVQPRPAMARANGTCVVRGGNTVRVLLETICMCCPPLMWPHALHLCSPGQQWLGQMALGRMALVQPRSAIAGANDTCVVRGGHTVRVLLVIICGCCPLPPATCLTLVQPRSAKAGANGTWAHGTCAAPASNGSGNWH